MKRRNKNKHFAKPRTNREGKEEIDKGAIFIESPAEQWNSSDQNVFSSLHQTIIGLCEVGSCYLAWRVLLHVHVTSLLLTLSQVAVKASHHHISHDEALEFWPPPLQMLCIDGVAFWHFLKICKQESADFLEQLNMVQHCHLDGSEGSQAKWSGSQAVRDLKPFSE